jgi:hypothetical protein
MKRLLFPLLALLLALPPGRAHPQAGDEFGFGGGADDGGFGFDASPGASPAPALPGVAIGGEVSAELLGYADEFDSWSSINAAELGDVFSGALNFSASGSAADGVINLNLAPTASPVSIDEAYLRAYFGPVNIEGGLRKLTWGRADSFGPLDVINPLDYTDLTKIADPVSVKLARPLVRVSWGIGSFSTLEGVFVPGFQGHRFALDGRWAPTQLTGLSGSMSAWLNAFAGQSMGMFTPYQQADLMAKLGAFMANPPDPRDIYRDSEPGLRYAQAGLRFATSIGSSDFGAQYYYGRLPRPALNIQVKPGFISPNADGATVDVDPNQLSLAMDYNSYHQIGVDFARVIAGFNVRAEAAVNITEDLEGDQAGVYNPFAAWSLGFDRDLVAGINANFQASETIRLFHDKIGEDPMAIDTEEGKDPTSTRLTLILSKKFFRDKLELKAVGLWDIEETGFLIMPGIAYSSNDVSVELQGGIFGGERDGELGQYRDNHFVKTILTYSF